MLLEDRLNFNSLYNDIGDYLNRQEKFDIIEKAKSIERIEWQKITPNQSGDWINQRNPLFEKFIELGNKESNSANVIFNIYSQGILSGRDAWVYNMCQETLKSSMQRMLDTFNKNSKKYQILCANKSKDQFPKLESIIDSSPREISWTHRLKEDVIRGKLYNFEAKSIVKGMYRPFVKQNLYFNRALNERVYQQPKLFPTAKHENLIISITGIGANKPFSAIIAKTLPDYEMMPKGQCFPLYWYEKIEGHTPDGYIRHSAISDWALQKFRRHYKNDLINKEDIFWYVYGILHSQEYKQRFSTNLKKMLARIPLAKDFHAFCDAGYQLGKLHLDYETIAPYPLTEDKKNSNNTNFLVRKMVFGKKDGKPDKTSIIVI